MPQFIDTNKVTAAFSFSFPFRFEELRETLQKLGYDRPTDGMVRARVSESGQTVVLPRLTKDNMNILYDDQKGFLTIESDSEIEALHDAIQPVFDAVMNLKSLAATTIWFEANFVCRELGVQHPLSSEVPPSEATKLFKDTSGLNPKFFSRSYCAFLEDSPERALNKVEDWVHITVGVFVPNPRYYQMSFLCRRTNLEDVIKFYKEIPTMIEKYSDHSIWGL